MIDGNLPTDGLKSNESKATRWTILPADVGQAALTEMSARFSWMLSNGAVTRVGNFSVDDIDRAIVNLLRANGRTTNQQIADQLGLTAATVSTRIRRMEDARQLRVVAVSDFSAHGYNVLLEVAIEVEGRPASEVAEELAKLPEVFAAHLVTGRYDIDMLVALHDFSELSEFMMTKLAGIRGIRSLVPAIAIDVVKYHFDVAPIDVPVGK